MLKRLLLSCMIALAPLCSIASSLGISSVHIHFAPGEKIESVTLKNKSKDPLTLQMQVFQWSQKTGQNVYTPTQAIIVTPAIFSIAPGETQLVRMALRNPPVAAPTQQYTYRLFLTQILPTKVKQMTPEQVNTKLKISLPIFIDLPQKAEIVKLMAKHSRHGVILINAGNVTRLINQIRWMKNDGTTPIGAAQHVFIYLLPGTHYTLPGVVPSHTLQILTQRKLELLNVV